MPASRLRYTNAREFRQRHISERWASIQVQSALLRLKSLRALIDVGLRQGHGTAAFVCVFWRRLDYDMRVHSAQRAWR